MTMHIMGSVGGVGGTFEKEAIAADRWAKRTTLCGLAVLPGDVEYSAHARPDDESDVERCEACFKDPKAVKTKARLLRP